MALPNLLGACLKLVKVDLQPLSVKSPPLRMSPIATRTRNRVKQVNTLDPTVCDHVPDSGEPSTNDSTIPCTSPQSQLLLQVPESLTRVTKRFEDFVKCENMEDASAVEELMRLQWSNLVVPGMKVKVKLNNEVVSAVIVECNYTSKVSFDCLYCFATAKANVKLSDSNCIREIQFRDLIL